MTEQLTPIRRVAQQDFEVHHRFVNADESCAVGILYFAEGVSLRRAAKRVMALVLHASDAAVDVVVETVTSFDGRDASAEVGRCSVLICSNPFTVRDLLRVARERFGGVLDEIVLVNGVPDEPYETAIMLNRQPSTDLCAGLDALAVAEELGLIETVTS